jgi:hypothetical protein
MKGTVAAFADYVQYSPILWYRGFYNTVYYVLFQPIVAAIF